MNTEFWGMTSVVINYDRFISQTGLTDLTQANFKVALVDQESGEVFWGDARTLDQALLVQPLGIRGNSWSLAVASAHPSKFCTACEVRLIGYSTLVLMVLVVIIAVRLFRQNYDNATRDMLTGLANRRVLFEKLRRLVKRHRRTGKGFTIFNLDLNKFKDVNDNFGHYIGDELLRGVARRLTKVAQQMHGIAIRTGGDEFIILAPNTYTPEQLTNIVKDLQKLLIDEPYAISAHHIQVGASIGTARYPEDSDNIEALLALADGKMYEQKRARG